MKKWILLVGLIWLSGSCLLAAPGKDRESLDMVAKKIEEINDKLENLKKQEKSILNDVYSIELQYEKAIIESNKLKMELRYSEEKLNAKNSEKKKLESEIGRSKENLKHILRLLYKIGGNVYLKLFIRIDNLDQLFKNYRMFLSLVDYKSGEIDRLKTNIRLLEAVKKELETHHTRLKNLQGQQEQKLTEIKGIKQSKLTLIREINSDRKQYMQWLDELEAEADQLNQLIYGKPLSRRLGVIDLDRLKGKLPWPVKGKVVSFFGRKRSTRFDTYIINNGIKIRPTESDEVKAVSPGEVVFADYFKGYGNLVIIQHAKNFYTLYGHCENISKQKGDNVEQGESIGVAGDSGSTSGKALYFELRTQLKPQDPLLWLSKKK